MATTITAGNATNGLAFSADNAGILELKTGTGAGTTAVTINASQNLLVVAPSALGYGTGAGGTVTQLTSKATAVTLNKPTGQITMSNAALSAGIGVVFTLNNSLIGTADIVVANIAGGATDTSNYRLEVTTASGLSKFKILNNSAGSLSEALIINFAIIKGATS